MRLQFYYIACIRRSVEPDFNQIASSAEFAEVEAGGGVGTDIDGRFIHPGTSGGVDTHIGFTGSFGIQ